MPKLTKPFCDAVIPPDKGYEIHWDDKVGGYGLRVTASGVRAFVAQGRVRGKAVIITIGRFGIYTEDKARKKAQDLLQQMRNGVDPRDVKKQEEAMKVTLRQVADAFFSRPGMLRDSTRDEMDRHLTTAFAKWLQRPIVSITAAECRKRYEEIAKNGLRKKAAAAPGSAASAFKILKRLINWAKAQYTAQNGKPIIDKNPVDVVSEEMAEQAKKRRKRNVDRRDIGAFWHLLITARQNPAFSADTLAGLDLVMFLLLTGTRRNEGAMLTWDRVNLVDGDNWFHLPDPKNKNPVWLPLSSQCVAVLKARKAADEKAKTKSKFVFPSRSALGHIRDTRAPLERFSKAIGMDRLSAHDLRRTFVTIGSNACRLDIAKLELLTNHKPQGVTQLHYLETSDLRDYHQEVQAIGDYIESEARVAAAKESGANVVPLHQTA